MQHHLSYIAGCIWWLHVLPIHTVCKQSTVSATTGGSCHLWSARWMAIQLGLVYSPSGDAAYCLPCVLFNNTSAPTSKALFITCIFSNWKDAKINSNGHFLGSHKDIKFKMFLDATNIYKTCYFRGGGMLQTPLQVMGCTSRVCMHHRCTSVTTVSSPPPPQPENPGFAPATGNTPAPLATHQYHWQHSKYWQHTSMLVTHQHHWQHTSTTGNTSVLLAMHQHYWQCTNPLATHQHCKQHTNYWQHHWQHRLQCRHPQKVQLFP